MSFWEKENKHQAREREDFDNITGLEYWLFLLEKKLIIGYIDPIYKEKELTKIFEMQSVVVTASERIWKMLRLLRLFCWWSWR